MLSHWSKLPGARARCCSWNLAGMRRDGKSRGDMGGTSAAFAKVITANEWPKAGHTAPNPARGSQTIEDLGPTAVTTLSLKPRLSSETSLVAKDTSIDGKKEGKTERDSHPRREWGGQKETEKQNVCNPPKRKHEIHNQQNSKETGSGPHRCCGWSTLG